MNEIVVTGSILVLAFKELKFLMFKLGDDATVKDVYVECFRRTYPELDVEEHRSKIIADSENWLKGGWGIPDYVESFVLQTKFVRALTA